MKNEQQLKEIPYGISDYDRFWEDNLYYVDKTRFIRNIEKKGSFLFFIRPRRFGKSLFLSTLESYYDINQENQFDHFFQGTDIHKAPTPRRNSYLIFKLDFSAVDPETSKLEEAFIDHIRDAADVFLTQYQEYLDIDINKAKEELNSRKSPAYREYPTLQRRNPGDHE